VVSDQRVTGQPWSKPRSAPQTRILKVALDLFGEHGVSGTSLQMIADAVGVTKAAVYRQFKTKDEIIIAVTEMHRMVGILQSDPVIIRLLAEHEPFRLFLERLYGVLIGDEKAPESLVQAAMLSGAIGGAVMHPLVTHLDDAMLRSHLMRLARRLIDLLE
jgi:AcrR family transcriptional regulator